MLSFTHLSVPGGRGVGLGLGLGVGLGESRPLWLLLELRLLPKFWLVQETTTLRIITNNEDLISTIYDIPNFSPFVSFILLLLCHPVINQFVPIE